MAKVDQNEVLFERAQKTIPGGEFSSAGFSSSGWYASFYR